jgi:Four helix bundle sensory module for signal transduction
MQWTKNKERTALIVGCGLALTLILFAFFAKYSNNSTSMRTVYENILTKKGILSEIHINMLKSVEMEKSAVMALTDQESRAYANQSQAASATVDQNLKALRAMVDAMPAEKKLLDEFATCWTEMGKIDQVILPLAVENTNLKAAALSREQGGQSMQRFEEALDAVRTSSVGSPSESRITALNARAMVAALKIYSLHGPHIFEPDNGKMDQIEERVKKEERVVMQSLVALETLLDKEHTDVVVQAKTAFAEFLAVTNQVVQLSRLNSNIKSLELSLGRKRTVVAQCDDALAALQESVQQKTFKATK